MQTENRVAGGGITAIQLLQVAFIVLKICNVINWPWVVVLMPLWIQLGIIAIIVFVWTMVAIFRKH